MSLTKHPQRCYTKLHKASGELKAGSIGNVAESGNAGFRYKGISRYHADHSFIEGFDVLVCAGCGFTKPKE